MVLSRGFAPRASAFARRCAGLLHFESFEKWCGMPVLPRRDEFGRLACCCYINAAKLVAGVGIAPTSADFQPAAHLSEPSSVWNLVPRRGVAPRSPAYRAGALLLSYGGMKLAEHQRIALWTPLRGAAVFGTVSSSMPDVLREMVPAPGLAPGTTAVRSGVCNAVTPCGR